MASNRLDDVANALRDSFEKSQETIAQQQSSRLSRLINMDEQGEPDYLTWECRLPAGDGQERNFELLRMPYASLSHTQTYDIAEVSIELDCKIKKNKAQNKQSQPTFTATPVKREEANQEELHRLKLKINNQQPEPTVKIDNETIDAFFAEQLSAKQLAKERTQKKRKILTVAFVLTTLFLAVAAVTYFLYFP